MSLKTSVRGDIILQNDIEDLDGMYCFKHYVLCIRQYMAT